MVERYRSIGAKMLKDTSGAYVAYDDHKLVESEMENIIYDLHNDVKLHTKNAQHWMNRAHVYENESERLESRVRELELQNKGHQENYNIQCKRFKELEAELDELKFKYKHWQARYKGQYKMTQELRARHASLVGAAKYMITCAPILNLIAIEKLKAALAEVK
jgi:chromosome segregation ATPase